MKRKEWREWISKINKGKPKTKEHRKKLSESKKGKCIGKDNPFYGRKHSKESKKSMSQKHTGKIVREETKQKLSIALSGKNNPFYGRTHTAKSIDRMCKNNPRYAKVKDPNTNIIYYSINEASRKTGISKYCIKKEWERIPGRVAS